MHLTIHYHIIKLLKISIFRSKTAKMSTDNLCRDAMAIFEAAYKSVQPFNLINKHVKVYSNTLQVQGKSFNISKNVHVVGFGKAVLGMAIALEAKLKDHIMSGIISVPDGMQTSVETEFRQSSMMINSCIQVYEGASKNIPDDNALSAATKITELVTSLKETDVLIVLISGGGSALLPAPKSPLTLKEKQKVISLLVSKGADIEELNAVRKQLSVLKGGKLALLAKPAKVISLILSDIIGDPISMIASGPTIVNNDDPSLPMSIIEKYGLISQLPKSAIHILKEISCKTEKDESFSHVSNFILGNNEIALNVAAQEAQILNYQSIILTNKLRGVASTVGRNLISLVIAALQDEVELFSEISKKLALPSHLKNTLHNMIQLHHQGNKVCLLLGGETTVEVSGTGVGGRNQELSLAAALELQEKSQQDNIVLLSGGTDGIDGPTCAAGAIATISSIEEAKRKGLDPLNFLINNDSYTFYSQVSNGKWQVKTGHTGTNVMDIIIILIKKEP